MNKKVLTLCAGFLLVGGLFSTASAEFFSDLVKTDLENQFYYVKVQGGGTPATDASYNLTYGGQAIKNSTDKWIVKKVISENGTVGYQLINPTNNKALTVTETAADGTVTEYKTFAKTSEQGGLWFIVDGAAKGFKGSLIDASVSNENDVWQYRLDKVPNAASTEVELEKQFGDSFGIQIGKQNDKGNFELYNGFEGGNVFDGRLYAKTVNGKLELYKDKAQTQRIVLTTNKWDVTASTLGEGYMFKVMSNEDIAKEEVKGEKSIILGDEFTVSAPSTVKGEPLEIAVFDKKNACHEILVSVVKDATGKEVNRLTVAATDIDYTADYTKEASENKANTYVKFGLSSATDLVELVKKGTYFNLINAEATTKGQVAAIVEKNNKNTADWVAAEKVLLASPEAQWYINSIDGGQIVFKNRETNIEWTTSNKTLYDVAEGVYGLGEDTLQIVPVQNVTPFDGFVDYDNTSLLNGSYTIASYKAVGSNLYLAENHKSSHKIGLEEEVENATLWKLNKLTGKTDTVKVVNEVIKWDAQKGTTCSAKETLKIYSYTFKNELGEPINFYSNGVDKYYVCNPDKSATRFALKMKPNGYNIVEVKENGDADALHNIKMYAGDSETNGGLHQVSTIYDQTENDLFVIERNTLRDYRRVANLDTIAINSMSAPSNYLYEAGNKENDINFLGIMSKNDQKIAPNMVAVETYSDEKNDFYKPEYMLLVDPTITEADTTWCQEHGHSLADKDEWLACPHTKVTPASISGRYLVNFADSAKTWADAHKDIHPMQNPYLNKGQNVRLGFVDAKYVNHKLVIASDSKDSLAVENAGWTPAEFSFKYVDREEGTFKIETSIEGETYVVKDVNNVLVLVKATEDLTNAEVFNIDETFEGAPTANEEISTSSVVVAGVDGAVVVKGAEGKNVIVSTILGKVVANEVVSSDNAQIAAPAGIVVVSVDGESFKVVVK